MPVSDDFREFVLEQLRAVTPVTWKRMFGAVGLYADSLFFAIIDDDTLYYKVGDASRPRYVEAGSKAFDPYGDGRDSKTYFELPPDVIEDEEKLREWTREALDAARTAKPKRKR
ncbi:MAG TPA: TfoX/Sxy family protein [Thermoanaerobaculia bacterium]|jgi:DNA transformation protein